MPDIQDRGRARARRGFARFAVAAGLASLATLADAHDYWIERSGDAYTLFQGHLYSSHKGEARVPYDPAVVKRVACAPTEGNFAILEPARTYPLRVEGRCAAVLIEMSSYWTQTLTETIQKPRTEVRGALRGWRSDEAVKRIDVWTPALAKPIADGLEIVPLDNPLTAKPGDKLRVLVAFRGQPRSGATVAYDGNARGVTGADGQLNIRIRHGGAQALSASAEEALQEPAANKLIRGAILQFDLPP